MVLSGTCISSHPIIVRLLWAFDLFSYYFFLLEKWVPLFFILFFPFFFFDSLIFVWSSKMRRWFIFNLFQFQWVVPTAKSIFEININNDTYSNTDSINWDLLLRRIHHGDSQKIPLNLHLLIFKYGSWNRFSFFLHLISSLSEN